MRGPVGGNELVARGSWGSLNFDTQDKQLLSRIFSHTTKICTHTHNKSGPLQTRKQADASNQHECLVLYLALEAAASSQRRDTLRSRSSGSHCSCFVLPFVRRRLLFLGREMNLQRSAAHNSHLFASCVSPSERKEFATANRHCLSLFVCTSWLSLKSYQPTKKLKKKLKKLVFLRQEAHKEKHSHQ